MSAVSKKIYEISKMAFLFVIVLSLSSKVAAFDDTLFGVNISTPIQDNNGCASPRITYLGSGRGGAFFFVGPGASDGSPAGKVFMSGSWSNAMRVWDVESYLASCGHSVISNYSIVVDETKSFAESSFFGITWEAIGHGQSVSKNYTLGISGAVDTEIVSQSVSSDQVAPVLNIQESGPEGSPASANPSADIILTFNEDIAVGTGNITVYDDSDNLIQAFDVSSEVSPSGKTLTLNPTSDLTPSGNYYIQIDSSAVLDVSGNQFLGISDKTSLTFTIDQTGPTVTNVTSSTADGSYRAGDSITIRVTFSERIKVIDSGGTPQLALDTGHADFFMEYYSSEGLTDTLTFTYTVQTGETSSDLDYASTAALALNGGTIKDAAGNSAILTLPNPGESGSLSANKALVIDAAAPTITFSPVDGATAVALNSDITLIFNEAIRLIEGNATITNENVNALITLKVDDGNGANLDFNAVIVGNTITIDPDNDFRAEQVIYVAIGATLEDASNNAISAASSTFTAVETALPTLSNVNLVSSNTTPTIANIGDTVTLTFTADEAIATPVVIFVSGGAAINDTSITYVNTSGTTWTAAYTVDKGDTFGGSPVTFTIDFADIVGNNGVAITQTTSGASVTSPVVTVPFFDTLGGSLGSALEDTNGQGSYSVFDGGVPIAVILRDANNIQLTNDSLISSVTVEITSGEGKLTKNPTGTKITIPSAGTGVFDFEIISTSGGVVTVRATVTTTDGVVHIMANDLSVTFVENAASATGTIEIVTQPELGVGAALLKGELLTTQPVVRLLDSNGDLLASDHSTNVTVRIISGEFGSLNANGAATTVEADSGVSAFIGLKLKGNANQVYRLVFMADGFVPAISQAMSFTTAAAFAAVKADVESKMASNARTQLNDFASSTSSIVSSARSRFMNKGGLADDSDTDLNGDISTVESDLKGSTKHVIESADGKAIKIIEAQFSYTKTKEGLKSQNASGQILWEQKRSDQRTVGRFFGVTMGNASAAGTNNIDIDFRGAQIGAYFLSNVKDDLVFDAYLAGSLIENTMGVTTEIMTAKSTYLSAMLTSGISVSGTMDVKRVEIRPTLSFDVSHMLGQTADFNVAVGTATSVEQASYSAISKAQLTFAPEFRLPIKLGGSYWEDSSIITVTPNVKCRYLKQGKSTTGCGQGLLLGFKANSKDGLNNLTANVGMDRIGSETTSTLKLMFNAKF